MSRITLDWMKLAVKRMAALLFGIPVLRVYNDHGNEQEKLAAQILEAVYTKNRINAVNKKRARYLYASCEIATIHLLHAGAADILRWATLRPQAPLPHVLAFQRQEQRERERLPTV